MICVRELTVLQLYRAKSSAYFKDTQSRFDKVLKATFQTGFVTTILATLSVILLLADSHSEFYSFPYVNSL